MLGAVVCLLVLCAGVSVVSAGEPAFGESRGLGVSDSTFVVATGDMDRDGHIDIVVGNARQLNAVYLNDGTGAFHATEPYVRSFGTGLDSSRGLAVGDVDGDGHLDIVVGNSRYNPYPNEPNVVYFNDRRGSFPYTDTYTTSFGTGADNTYSVAVGDMDGDGDLDIVTGNYWEQNAVYLNSDSGTFPYTPAFTRPFGTGSDYTRGVAVGDMDGDGDLDIVVGNWQQQNRVYLNDGGDFSASRDFGPGSEQTYGIAIGDVDGDGSLDIIVGNHYSTQPDVVYLNDGSAGFYTGTVDCALPPANASCLGDGGKTESVALADMDGDGDLDVIAGLTDAIQNAVYLNNGGGVFTATVGYGIGDDDTYSVAVADLDRDGHLDIVNGNYGGAAGKENRVFLNSGSGRFPDGSDLEIMPGYWGWDVALGDLDRNGDLDAVFINAGGDDGYTSTIYANDGSGGLVYQETFATGTAKGRSVALGDMNGDRWLDIVVGIEEGYNAVYLNDGSGGFPHDGDHVSEFGLSSGRTRGVAVGDVDGDGDLDIVAGDFLQQNTVHFNDGTGVFTYTAPVTCPVGDGSDKTSDVALGDVDGDGDLDVVVGNLAQQDMVYLNDGNATFEEAHPIGAASDRTVRVALGDMNGDGYLDVVVGTEYQQDAVYLNDGSGYFGPGRDFGTGAGTSSGLALTDMDGDGDLDVVVGNDAGYSGVYWNDGGANFDWYTPRQDFAEGLRYPAALAVGDLDSDGDFDIVLSRYNEAKDGQNHVILSGSRHSERLANNLPFLTLSRPGNTGEADLYSSAEILANRFIPVTFGLYDPEGEPVRQIVPYYSPDGGGKWYDAVANNTRVLELATCLPGQSQRVFSYVSDDSFPLVIPGDGTDATSLLRVPDYFPIADVDVWLNIGHDDVSELEVYVVSPDEGEVRLFGARTISGTGLVDTVFDDAAPVPIGLGSPPYTDRFQPEEMLKLFNGRESGGRWYLVVRDTLKNTHVGDILSWGMDVRFDCEHTYTWDTFASGFFGRSDNVVFRMEVYPSLRPYSGTVAGPYQWPYVAAQTFPFRVRGTQVRVMGEGSPVPGALVYRIPAGQERGGTLFVDGSGRPLRTDNQGYLQGRGQLQVGDRLVALRPVVEEPIFLDEDFEGGFLPPGWQKYSEPPACPGWVQAAKDPHSGDQHAFHGYYKGIGGNADSWLVTPQINVPPGGRLVFWQRDAWQDYYNYHSVWVSTGGPEPSDSGYKEVWQGDTGDEWNEQVIDLGEYVGQDVYIAFRYKGYSADDWYIDDVSIVGIADMGYRMYHASASPSEIGLNAHTVGGPGVQVLTVSTDNPLMLFDLSVSLQWDARNDEQFMSTLTFDLERASEFLYDWTDGQVALGEVTVHHDRDYWNEAHVRVYASNELRPSATQGGVVGEVVTDTDVLTITYAPGQVLMGAEWNRYGEAGSSIDEDWPRTFAHELGHYLLFLADNYLGLDASDQLVTVEGCPGAMTDPYRKDEPYDEFHLDDASWDVDCAGTLSEQTTGRADWATINMFYPWLTSTLLFAGPNGLPLEVTQVREAELEEGATALDDPTFYLLEGGSRVQPGSGTRAFLYQEGWAVDLGSPTQDTVLARGAGPGDTVCVYELSATARRMGCEAVSETDEELELVPRVGWAPDIVITPVNSRTINITVTNNADVLAPVSAVLYPLTEPASGTIPLTGGPRVFTGVFDLAYPVLEGYVRVRVDEGAPWREAIADYAIGGNPASLRGWHASLRGWHASLRGWHASLRGWHAPMSSVDGQMILYVDETELGDEDFYAVQSTTYIPSPPPWTSVVGKAYRIMASPGVTNLVEASVYWTYMSDDVPTGEEAWVRLYHWNTATSEWDALPTTVDTYHNSVSAPCDGPGLYALMSSYEVPLYGPGWNLVSYPLQESMPVTDALMSVTGSYTTVFEYEAADGTWAMYDVTVSPPYTFVNSLKALRYGYGYWINASGVVTWQVSGGDTYGAAAQIEGAATSQYPPFPPATYYGEVWGGDGFVPEAGEEVLAWVEGHLCGRGETVAMGDQVGYAVHVFAASSEHAGCGMPGQVVTFEVGGYGMAESALWDTSQIWRLDLSPEQERYKVYLPLTLRDAP
jgi:hypothetical protein